MSAQAPTPGIPDIHDPTSTTWKVYEVHINNLGPIHAHVTLHGFPTPHLVFRGPRGIIGLMLDTLVAPRKSTSNYKVNTVISRR